MRMNLKKLTLALSLGAVVAGTGLTGCATADRTAERRLEDRRVSRRVKEALDNNPIYKFQDVQVATFDGVVQLNGFANIQDQKGEAAKVAQGVPGVRQLINNISLKPQEKLEPTTGRYAAVDNSSASGQNGKASAK
jgi:hyperosmotically inducible protein